MTGQGPCALLVGSVPPQRGVPAVGPAEGLSGPASGRVAGGPSQSQHHQRGARAGFFSCLQLSPWRPLPAQPVQHPEQAFASYRCLDLKVNCVTCGGFEKKQRNQLVTFEMATLVRSPSLS